MAIWYFLKLTNINFVFTILLEARGTGSFLMKVGSKRRRSMQQIKKDKEDELDKLKDLEEKS